ncbi:MAG: response regulator transcription factor [Chloroflexota bacterium]|jgi:DNA-binding response OmpR family regulator
MTTKILLADDDECLTRTVGLALEEIGYKVDIAHNGLEAIVQVQKDNPNLVILDVMLPRVDGWETCRRIREISNAPILMLTARDGECDEVKGLRSGADVYMTKPFALSVLLAQVEALLRRNRPTDHSTKLAEVSVGNLQINLPHREVSLAGQPVALSPTEFRLLAVLAARLGRVVSHRDLLTEVWGPEYADETTYLKLYVWYLRKKIEEDPNHPQYILTKRGQGYYLNANPSHELTTTSEKNARF